MGKKRIIAIAVSSVIVVGYVAVLYAAVTYLYELHKASPDDFYFLTAILLWVGIITGATALIANIFSDIVNENF